MYVFSELHWFWLVFGAWDALFTIVFLLFLCQVVAPDLTSLNAGEEVVPGV